MSDSQPPPQDDKSTGPRLVRYVRKPPAPPPAPPSPETTPAVNDPDLPAEPPASQPAANDLFGGLAPSPEGLHPARIEDDISSWPLRGDCEERYGLTPAVLRHAEREGTIRAYKDSLGKVHYNPSELEALADRKAATRRKAAVEETAVDLLRSATDFSGVQTRHTEAIFKTALSSAQNMIKAQQDTIGDLLKRNADLTDKFFEARENEIKLRHTGYEHEIKIKEIEVEAKSAERGYAILAQAIPVIGSLVTSHAQPNNPGALDPGILGWIRDLTEEQGTRIVFSGVLGPDQLQELQALRDSPVADGRFARWLRSVRPEQMHRLAQAGILRDDQFRNLLALHGAATERPPMPYPGGVPGPQSIVTTPPSSAPLQPTPEVIGAASAVRNAARVEGAFKAFSSVIGAIMRLPDSLRKQVFDSFTPAEREAWEQACDVVSTLE